MKFNVLETFGRWEEGGSICRDTSPMCVDDALHAVGRTTLSLFSLFRGMSRGKVIRLHRRKQDNISGEPNMG